MDDLSALLGNLLSDPENVRQLGQAAAALGLSGEGQPGASGNGPRVAQQRPGRTMAGRRSGGPSPAASPKEDELAALRQMLGQLQSPQPAAPAAPQNREAPALDLSALSGILAGLTGGAPPPPPEPEPEPSPGGGFNLSALSDILGNLGGGQQAQNNTPDLSALLGALGGGQQPQSNTPDLSALLGALGGGQQPQSNTPDLSALLGALGGGQQPQSNAPDLSALLGALGGGQQTQSNTPDLSALLGALGGGQQPQSNAPDLSGLQGVLGGLTGGGSGGGQPSAAATLADMLGGPGSAGPAAPLGGMDLGMLLKFQQAISGMSANAGNVRLLLSVKNHLKDEDRKAKVDDAIRVMQVIQFLPLLKESGLFGKLEEILDGFGMGGIGSALGNLGNLGGGSGGGLGSLLGALTGRR